MTRRPSLSATRREPAGFEPEGWLIPSARTAEDDPLSMFNRADPYWDRLWAPGSQAVWTSRHSDANGEPVVSFGTRENKRLLMSRDEAMDILTSNRGRAERLAAWGVLDSWRTASADQLAVLTGSTLFLDPNYSQVVASFATELLDVGSFALRNGTLPGRGQPALFRPRAGDAFEKELKKTLTWPEWISVTGGYDWSSGGQFDRHNLLATELAIRAAEYLPGVGTVMGEKFSSVRLLAGLSKQEEKDRKSRMERAVAKGPESEAAERVKQARGDNRRGDGTIVRSDGLRIVYELTATSSKTFESKVRRWAQTITKRPLETSGIAVVFVAAPHPDRSRNNSADPFHDICKSILEVLKEFPGTTRDDPAARIGVAHWQEWFPSKGTISDGFLNLEANFAIGASSGPDRWILRPLMSTTEYPFTAYKTTFDAMALIENSRLLTATPHWLRTGDHTDLIGTPLQRPGRKEVHTIPVPFPARPGRTMGRPLGAAVGAVVHPTRTPERLRIEGRDVTALAQAQERRRSRAATRAATPQDPFEWPEL